MTEIQRQTLSTRAAHVTLFEDRAQVTRTITVTLTPGTHILTLTGVTRFIDDQSLTVGVASEDRPRVELGASRVIRKLVATPDEPESDVDLLEVKLQELFEERLRTQQELARCQVTQAHLKQLEASLLAQMRLVPDGEASTPAHFAEALEKLDARFLAHHDTRHDLLDAMERLERQHSHASQQLEAARRITQKLVAHVEVPLECNEAGEFTLTLEYMTGCALWRPAHRARLARKKDDPSHGTLHIDTLATVWQATGELWEQVTCHLSTARPTQQAAPPKLTDDVLRARQKTDHERRVIEVSARDEIISNTGAQGARLVDDMPGVDDGGEPLELQAKGQVSIPSTGEPHTLHVDTIKLPCTLDVVAMPELSQVAHLRAKTIWSHKTPLLAGPITLVREQELAGQTSVKFVAPGEPLDIGFGTESALRVRREVQVKHIDKRLSRHRREERRITLHVSNMSHSSRALHILERIPVSELEQVQVSLTQSEGARPDSDGFLTIKANLGPNQHTTYEIAYELDIDPKVNLDF